MSTPSVIIRPVRREDAADLQVNCFSRNTLEEVQQQIEGLLSDFTRGHALRLVAEVAETVVGNTDLIRETHRLKRHCAGWGGVVVWSLPGARHCPCPAAGDAGPGRSLGHRAADGRCARWHARRGGLSSPGLP